MSAARRHCGDWAYFFPIGANIAGKLEQNMSLRVIFIPVYLTEQQAPHSTPIIIFKQDGFPGKLRQIGLSSMLILDPASR